LKHKLLTGIAAIALVSQGIAPAEAKSFSSCSSLLKTYSTGIAASKNYKNKNGTLASKPKISASIYKSNRKLDLDKDGIICERIKRTAQKPAKSPNLEVPSSSPPVFAAPTISLENLDQTWTSKVAAADTLKLLEGVRGELLAPQFISSPNVRKADLELEQRLVQDAIFAFSRFYSPSAFKVVMFTNADSEWADAALIEHGGSFPYKVSQEIAKFKANCNFAFATRDNRSGSQLYYTCSDTRFDRDRLSYQTPIHEYYHLVHNGIAPVQGVPVWLFEGSASYFGEVLGYRSFENPGVCKEVQNFRNTYQFDPKGEGFDSSRFEKWRKSASEEDFITLFSINENKGGAAQAFALYAIGSWATEALVAVYGTEKFMEIWPEIAKTNSFEASFKTIFGITASDFYKSIAEYIRSKKMPTGTCR
jgi:hypothetical protein